MVFHLPWADLTDIVIDSICFFSFSAPKAKRKHNSHHKRETEVSPDYILLILGQGGLGSCRERTVCVGRVFVMQDCQDGGRPTRARKAKVNTLHPLRNLGQSFQNIDNIDTLRVWLLYERIVMIAEILFELSAWHPSAFNELCINLPVASSVHRNTKQTQPIMATFG